MDDRRTQELLESPAACAFMLLMESEGLTINDAARPIVAFALGAQASDAVNPWATAEPRQVVAELRERARSLEATATQLANSSTTAWWWSDLERGHQHEPVWQMEREGRLEGAPPLRVPNAPPSRWERYAHKHEAARWTSTVHDGVSGLSVAIARGVGDLLGVANWTSLREVTVAPEVDVFEVHGARDWHRLCVEHPALRPAASPLSTDEVVPDWSAVVHGYAGVHLSFGGWLCALWNEVSSDAGTTTMWTWESECTMWLRDVLEPGTVTPFPAGARAPTFAVCPWQRSTAAPGCVELDPPVATQHLRAELRKTRREAPSPRTGVPEEGAMNTEAHAATLAGCFPDLAVTRSATGHFDDGWDCQVVVLDGELVARLPRRPEVQGPLQIEGRFLDLLGRVTDVPAPRPLQVCETHGSMVYRLLPGAPLSEPVLERMGEHVVASQVAAVLRAVWDLPVKDAIALGVPHRDLGPALRDFRRRVLPLVDDLRAERVLDEAGTALLQPRVLAVIHADVGPAHLLFDDDGLAAVIDWSDVCVGDPATDLAWPLNGCGARLRRPLIERLGLDAATVARADLLHRLGPWWEVAHGLDQDQPHLVDSGLDGIRSRFA